MKIKMVMVMVMMLVYVGVSYGSRYDSDLSETERWDKLGSMEYSGGGKVGVEVMKGSVRLVRGRDLGGDQFSDVLIGRFRLGEQWNSIVPVEVCIEGRGRVSIIDTEVLRLYPGLSEYDIQTIVQNAAVGGGGNVRWIDLGKEVVDPVALSVKWLCIVAEREGIK